MQVSPYGSTHVVHGLLLQFDEAMNKALEKEVTTKTTFKGHLDSYRFCDQVLPLLQYQYSPSWLSEASTRVAMQSRDYHVLGASSAVPCSTRQALYVGDLKFPHNDTRKFPGPWLRVSRV